MQSSLIFYLLVHLLFLVLSCESFLSVWSSRQWKGNCLDQLSSICIFQRHHLSFKSIHSSSRTENNLWSDSFAFFILKQKCFMLSTPPTALGSLERYMCPGCFASHTFTCCFTCSFWWLLLMCEFGNDIHLLSLPATCSLLPTRAHPSDPSLTLWLCGTRCCGAILQSQQWVWWFREVHLHKLVVLHLYAITLFSCTSLSLLCNWALKNCKY